MDEEMNSLRPTGFTGHSFIRFQCPAEPSLEADERQGRADTDLTRVHRASLSPRITHKALQQA